MVMGVTVIMDVRMSGMVHVALRMQVVQAVGGSMPIVDVLVLMLMLMPVHGIGNGTLGEHS